MIYKKYFQIGIKCILAFILALLPVVNSVIDVFAASLSVLKITELSAYQTGPSSDSTSRGTLHVRNNSTGQEIDDRLALLSIDGEAVFCIEPLVKTANGYQYSATNESLESVLGSSDTRRKVSLLSYYGYGFNGDYSLLAYGATQIAIWEWQGYTISNITQEMRNTVENLKQRVNKVLLNNKPSFNGTDVILTGYGKDKAVTLTDTKNMFTDYYFTSSDFQYEKSGNTLKIWSDKYIEKGTVKFQLINPADSTRLGDSVVYVNPNQAQKVAKIYNKDPMTITVNVKVALGSLELAKKDNKGNYIPNTSFKISYNANMSNPIGTYKTSSTGKITVPNLEPKKVYVQEVEVPDNLLINSTIGSIDVVGNTTTTYTLTNQWKQGYVQVTKYDNKTGQVVKKQGAQFEILKNGKVVTTITTNNNGVAKSGLIDYGVYQVREKQAPANYELTTAMQNVEIVENGKTYALTFKNNPITGTVNLTKVDQETTDAQGDATLEKAKYVLKAKKNVLNPADDAVIYAKDEAVSVKKIGGYSWGDTGTKSTDKQSKLNWSNLPMGEYYVQEVAAPTGYLLSDTIYPVTLTADNQNTNVENEKVVVDQKVIKGRMQITKVGTDGETNNVIPALPGVEFTIKLYSDVREKGWKEAKVADKIVTEDNGIAISKELPYGNYMIKETKTPANYVPSGDFFVNIDQDGETEYRVVNNFPFKAWLKIVKINEDNEEVTLDSTTFKLKDKDGNYVRQKVSGKYVEEWTTDDTGSLMLNNMLLPGEYRITEIKNPKGLLLGQDQKVDIATSTELEFDEDNQPIITAYFVDESPKGNILLNKKFEREEDTATGGAKFRLTAKEEVKNAANGEILYRQGETVNIDGMHPDGLYSIDEGGRLEIGNLPLGTIGASYQLEEVSTIEGYTLLDKPISYIFEIKDNVTKEYKIEKNIKNHLTTTNFSKQDTGGKEIKGARLSLWDEKGDCIDSWISDGSKYQIKGLIYGRGYTWKEEISPDGYAIAKDIQFTYGPEMDGKTYVMKDKYVEVVLTDEIDKPLSGGKIQVISTKTKQIVDEWETNEKAHRIENLVEGEEYVLIEIETPKDRVTAKPIEFKVSKENQFIKIINKQVRIEKQDTKGIAVIGAKLQILDKETKELIDEWQTNENYHYANGLSIGGEYILRETEVPEGYIQAEDIAFKVDDSNNNQEVIMIDERILTDIVIKKIDAKTREPIQGFDFEFSMYADKECTEVLETVTGDKEKGVAIFKGVDYGQTVYIKESRAPKGYELSNEVIKITTNMELEGIGDIHEIEYVNEKEKTESIETGDTTPIETIGILCLTSIVLMIETVYRRKRRKR